MNKECSPNFDEGKTKTIVSLDKWRVILELSITSVSSALMISATALAPIDSAPEKMKAGKENSTRKSEISEITSSRFTAPSLSLLSLS